MKQTINRKLLILFIIFAFVFQSYGIAYSAVLTSGSFDDVKQSVVDNVYSKDADDGPVNEGDHFKRELSETVSFLLEKIASIRESAIERGYASIVETIDSQFEEFVTNDEKQALTRMGLIESNYENKPAKLNSLIEDFRRLAIAYNTQIRSDMNHIEAKNAGLLAYDGNPEYLYEDVLTYVNKLALDPGNPTGSSDKVFLFTPAHTGIYTFTTSMQDGYYEAILDIYSDSSMSSQSRIGGSAFFPVSPQMSILLTEGVTYYLAFSPFYAFGGLSFNLIAEYSQAPVYLNEGATIHTVISGGKKNVFTIVPPTDGNYKISVNASSPHTSISLLLPGSEVYGLEYGNSFSYNLNLMSNQIYHLILETYVPENVTASVTLTKEPYSFISATVNNPMNIYTLPFIYTTLQYTASSSTLHKFVADSSTISLYSDANLTNKLATGESELLYTLLNGSTYFITLSNTSHYYNSISFTITDDFTPPSPPTNLAIAGVNGNSLTLTWTGSSDNVGVVGYDIYNGSYKIGSASGTSTTYVIVPNITYAFTVKARDAAGNLSDSSNPVAFIKDSQAPTIPTQVRVTNRTGSSVTLAWNASTDNVGVTGYEIYRNSVLISSVNGSTLTFTDTGLVNGTTYAYSVKAKDAAGNLSANSNTVSVIGDTQAPTTPSGLTITNRTGTSVTLAWNASTDNIGVTGYEIYRNSVLISSVNESTLTFMDTGLVNGTAYNYSVKAKDAVGNLSGNSNVISVIGDTQAPSVPTQLRVTNRTVSIITVTWNASADNVGVNKYEIYRNNTLIGSVDGRTLSYTVSGVSPDTLYTFFIKAKDVAGNISVSSNLIHVFNGKLKYNYQSGRLKTITSYSTGQLVQTYNYDNNGNLLSVSTP